MIAECQFQRERYSWAQDSYDRLVKEFPGTRYLNTYARRQFEIARFWRQSPESGTALAILPVYFYNIRGTRPPENAQPTTWDPTRRVPILPNVHDRSRPMFDTNGRALQALKSIWLNDPTGPLADDALMLTASYYLRKGDYLEADRYYSILREEYPKSPHLENAFVLGSHVKLMSYDGPAYDGKALDEARELKASTLRLYPDHPDRERFLEEIRKIDEAKAGHVWEMVEFYQKKNRPRAVAIYCQVLIEKHPDSTYADRARQVLTRLPAEELRALGIAVPGRARIPSPPASPPPTEYDTPGRARVNEAPGRARL
jgi:tetratricopeptide (TPR) repeat protein